VPGIVISAVAVLLITFVAVACVLRLGLARHPSALCVLSIAGAELALFTIAIQAAAPLLVEWPAAPTPGIWTTYFLAMAHFFNSNAPYPFYWTPPWMYRVGTLTPLIAVGGITALAFGLAARRARPRIVLVSGGLGLGATVAFVALAAMAARNGVPL
jgi:hypothetical protein